MKGCKNTKTWIQTKYGGGCASVNLTQRQQELLKKVGHLVDINFGQKVGHLVDIWSKSGVFGSKVSKGGLTLQKRDSLHLCE